MDLLFWWSRFCVWEVFLPFLFIFLLLDRKKVNKQTLESKHQSWSVSQYQQHSMSVCVSEHSWLRANASSFWIASVTANAPLSKISVKKTTPKWHDSHTKAYTQTLNMRKCTEPMDNQEWKIVANIFKQRVKKNVCSKQNIHKTESTNKILS